MRQEQHLENCKVVIVTPTFDDTI